MVAKKSTAKKSTLKKSATKKSTAKRSTTKKVKKPYTQALEIVRRLSPAEQRRLRDELARLLGDQPVRPSGIGAPANIEADDDGKGGVPLPG